MSVQDALAGLRMLQEAFEKRKDRTFDLEKLLAEQKFQARENVLARKSAEKVAGIHAGPQWGRLRQEIREFDIEQAKGKEFSDEIARMEKASGLPAGTFKMEQLSAELTGTRSGLSGTALLDRMNIKEDDMLARLKERWATSQGNDKTLYAAAYNKMFDDISAVRMYEANRKAYEKAVEADAATSTQMPFNTADIHTDLMNALTKKFQGWDGEKPLIRHIRDEYGASEINPMMETAKTITRNVIDEYANGTELEKADSTKGRLASMISDSIGKEGYDAFFTPGTIEKVERSIPGRIWGEIKSAMGDDEADPWGKKYEWIQKRGGTPRVFNVNVPNINILGHTAETPMQSKILKTLFPDMTQVTPSVAPAAPAPTFKQPGSDTYVSPQTRAETPTTSPPTLREQAERLRQ